MSYGRRTNDRRRRTLYSAHQADQIPSTAAARREAERLREARRPTAAYGSRVHRRLQGRWYSLVPVRRRTMTTVAGLLAMFALLLCGAHYASVAWPSIAYRPEIARPLRLDRPDSLGRWFMVSLLAGSACASLLIYQLRRYRIDDYTGRYRIWRLVMIVMMLASVNSLVSIIDWSGALLDAGFGKRVALSGGDWIRLVVSLGGAVLALRIVAEVRRSFLALSMMIVACLMFAIPEAAKWNVLQVESLEKWAAVTSAPLLACTALLISLGGYLRMLYREVRQIDENDSLRERFQQMRRRVFQRSDDLESEDLSEQKVEPGQGQRGQRSPPADKPIERKHQKQKQTEIEADSNDVSTPREKRRWLGLRRAKTQQEAVSSTQSKDPLPPVEPRKKRRFSMRLDPSVSNKTEPQAEQQSSQVPDEPSPGGKQRRGGLGGWLRRDKEHEAESNDAAKSHTKAAPTKDAAAQAVQRSEAVNSEEIDWSSLSKAERRRLRKQLKRQNRAA